MEQRCTLADKAKLYLTRGRLFSFDSCNGFLAEYECGFNEEDANKAVKSLFAVYSLLGSAIKLEDDGAAFIEENRVGASVAFLEGDEKEICRRLLREGLLFSEKLFAFFVINNKTLFVLGHRAVSDARSLMYLAEEFLEFYSRKRISVESVCSESFSDIFSLPSNAFSPVVERLASDLEVGWQKKPAAFTVEDYKKAKTIYFNEQPQIKELRCSFEEAEFEALKRFSEKNGVDVSSVVAFAFFEALDEVVEGKRKFKKMNVVSNGRPFFEVDEKYKVAPLDGFVTVNGKRKKKADTSRLGKLKSFHGEIYKRVTSSFTVFYTDLLHGKVPPFFCDSAYMFAAGLWKQKYSKRLALTYGCANEVMNEFTSFNLEQGHWSGLSDFRRVEVFEPLKLRSASSVCFAIRDGEAEVVFRFKIDKISEVKGKKIFLKATETIRNITEI